MPTSTDDTARLRLDVVPLSPATTIDHAADIFLRPEHAPMLCLPVVDRGRVLGTVSRHTLNGIFLRRFGRELLGAKPVTTVMNARPLQVDPVLSLEAAAAYVTANLGSPITEDIVFVRDGVYAGMGIVLDLLSALQRRLERNAQQLADAYGQLKASQAQLVQSEKMASLGQMVAGVAHEINTPLGYVRNNVDMIQGVFESTAEALLEHDRLARMLTDADADAATLERQLAVCRSAVESLDGFALVDEARALFGDTLFGVDTIKELVVNLRNFSRLDQARTAEASLNDCIDQTLTIAHSVLKNKVEIIKRYGEIPKIRCSPSQINQVLLNIITNAAQAIEHGNGKILVRTECDGDWVVVDIQDNGKGIAPENLKKIFDPFFTTKPVGHGTGLGLSISFQIVQAHGGDIRVASEVGRGTRFIIRLPVKAAATEALAA